MSGDRIARKDYATGLISVLVLGIVLLPVGGVIIVGLLAPFIISGLLVMAILSMFTRRPR